MRLRRLLPIAGLLLAAAGCAQTIDATRIGVPVTLASAAGEAPAGEPFRVSGKGVYAFWGITQISSPALHNLLAGQLVGGSALANVRIKVRSRWSDVLVTVLTFGVLVPRTVTAEGIVVK